MKMIHKMLIIVEVERWVWWSFRLFSLYFCMFENLPNCEE